MDNEKRNGNEESTLKRSWENTVARIPRGKKRKLNHSLRRNRNFKISLRREHKDFKLTFDFAMPHPDLQWDLALLGADWKKSCRTLVNTNLSMLWK
jgi:hypothetical protein